MPADENKLCVKLLEQRAPEYYTKWKNIKEVFKGILNKGAASRDIAFTPHDYDNHCVNIFTSIGMLLSENDLEKKLTVLELFLLNTSVVLHDISMVYRLKERQVHSINGKNEVVSQVNRLRSSILGTYLTSDEAVHIGEIIYGHSNPIVNDESIDSLSLVHETLSLGDEKVRLRLLSAVLRLADELDVSASRIQGYFYESFEMENSSRIHWRSCDIQLLPEIPDKKEIIFLKPNADRINASHDMFSGVNKNYVDFCLLSKSRNKIQDELDQIHAKVRDISVLDIRDLKRVDIMFSNKELEKKYEEFVALSIEPKAFIDQLIKDDISQNVEVINSSFSKPKLITDEASSEMESLILNNDLVKSDHCMTHSKLRVRDWVYTNELLLNADHFTKIIDTFVLEVSKLKKCTFVGIGYKGLLIASTLGFRTKNAFTYMLANHEKESFSNHEITPEIDSDLDIVLITDIIITGSMIVEISDKLISEYKIAKSKIVKVLAILYRTPIEHEGLVNEKFIQEYCNKTSVINNSLDLELCSKKDFNKCIFPHCRNSNNRV